MDHLTLILILACLVGLLMTWGVGANDLANVMSTTMVSKTITIKQAILIAILFEFAGAYLGGIHVSDTVRNGIIMSDHLATTQSIQLVYGMLAVLMAGATWMLLASYFGLPVSITHTIIGAMVGFGSILLGTQAIHWNRVIVIALSWIISPLMAAFFAYLLFISLQRLIFQRAEPFVYAKRYAPFYLFLIGTAFSLAALIRGLERLHFHLTPIAKLEVTLGTGLFVTVLGSLLIRRIRLKPNPSRHHHFFKAEKIFKVLMVFTACAMVFAHGSNDIAIAIGPLMAIFDLLTHDSSIHITRNITYGVTFLGCTGVIFGFLTYGRNVIATVGKGITSLSPSRAFAATLSAALTVVAATGTGIPVSTTQVLVGAVFGVGIARGIGALNLIVIRNIFMSWMITIPAGALFSVIYFYCLHTLFG
jgi:inorganic phosphate transporter, PiT family